MSTLLFIASDYKPWPGGIGEYLDSLARGLIGLGNNVTLVAVTGPDEKERIRFLETYEPWVIPFPMGRDEKPENVLGRKYVSALEIFRSIDLGLRRHLERSSFFSISVEAIRRLEAILGERKPDIVIFGHLDVKLYPLALCLRERKVPYVIIAHDSEICSPPKSGRNEIELRRIMLKKADWIAANSKHTKSLTEAWGIPSTKVKIIYPPISHDAISESAVLDATSSRDNHLTLVTICRLVIGKGVDLVLRALKILDDRQIPYSYLIGGDGPERKALESLTKSLGLRGKVDFRGLVAGEQKWRLLSMADIFVTTSRFDPSGPWREGFGIAFVEAAAFGIPVVASNSGGIPDAVVDNETGILVPEESPQDIADALTRLYMEPESRKRMGEAARLRAREQFTPAAIAKNFQVEFVKMLRTGSRTSIPQFGARSVE